MRQEFSEVGIDVKNKTSGIIRLLCPKCNASRTNKRDKSLSVDIPEGLWNCHYCGWGGKLKDNTIKRVEKKSYVQPTIVQQNLSEKTQAWFAGRGIGHQTLVKYNVTESREWLPQVEKERNCINFNYYREGKLVNVKFRDSEKNFKMVSGAELVFYGLDFINEAEYIIITEGEIDALSVYEALKIPALSVPNGASKGSMKLEYLDNCIDSFDGYKKIIIATDGDSAGLALRDELARRLDTNRCYYVAYPSGCKDTNEVLLKLGKPAVAEMFRDVYEFPMNGIAYVSDFEDEIDDIYENGYPKCHTIGHTGFDKLLAFRGGEVTTVTGYPGSGKSEFVDEITMQLGKLHGWRTGVASFENPRKLHFVKLAERFIGKKVWDENPAYKMSPKEYELAKLFINEHYYFVNPNEADITVDGLIKLIVQLVKRKGINAFIIDP